MRTDSLRDADSFEQLIKYIFIDFLRGFEDTMTMVSEELRGFGERGMAYEVIHWTKITLTLTLTFRNPKIAIFCK